MLFVQNQNLFTKIYSQDFSRRNSVEFGEASRDSEFVVLKERKLVPIEPVYEGMLRFSFLLETCQSGSVPDPHLMAAVIDLVSMPRPPQAIIYLFQNFSHTPQLLPEPHF